MSARRGMVVAAVALLVLAGCSEDQADPAPPPASAPIVEPSTAPPTPTPTAEPVPVMPPEAQQMDAEGAQAFAVYWFELAEHAYDTGDTTPMMSFASEHCSACQASAAKINEQYEGGGHFEGVELSIDSPAAPPPDTRGTVVSFLYNESASRAVDVNGDITEQTAAVSRQGVDLYLLATPDGWQIFNIANTAE